jgi:S-adenosyl methyltransferase
LSGTAAELDTTAPSGARAYHGLLGGLEPLFRPDREMIARMEAAFPPGVPGPRDMAIANRVYLQLAVNQATHAGARQVLDLGAGFPVTPLELRGAPRLRQLHEAAYRGTTVAYVDWNPQVISRGLAAVQDVPGVTYAHLDVADVAAVRNSAEVRSVIDFARPLTVVAGLTLNLFPPDRARGIVEGYLDGLRPGSRLVITLGWWRDEGLFQRLQGACGAGTLFSYTETQIMALFRGTSLLGNGIEMAQGEAGVAGRDAPACILGGVGRVG